MLCYQPPLVRTPARGVYFMGWWFIRFRSSLPFRVFCRTAYASKGLAAILCVDLGGDSSVAHPFRHGCARVVLHPNHDAPEASAILVLKSSAGLLPDRVIEPLSTAVQYPATRRSKIRPRGGDRRHGARAYQIAGACHGALAPWAKTAPSDFRTFVAAFGQCCWRDDNSRRSSRGC